jgi:hypothetical protein
MISERRLKFHVIAVLRQHNDRECKVKNTFANARENLSDEQLKHVTGGARVNSRPEAPDDHLIGHGDLDQHGAAAAAECHPKFQVGASPDDHLPDPEPAILVDVIQFSGPVTVQGLQDGSGHAITIDQIDVFSNGQVCAVHDIPGQPGHPGQSELFDLGNDGIGALASQTIINDAVAQGDQITVTGFQDFPVSLPNNG